MYALLLIPPLFFFGFARVLNTSGFPIFLLLCELPLAGACLEYYRPRFLRIGRWGPWLRILVYGGLLLFFLGYILLIPDTVYQGWLRLLEAGKPAGTVSWAFIIPLTLFSSLGCSWLILWKQRGQALLVCALLVNFVLIILAPGVPTLAPFLLLLLLSMVMSTPRGGRRKMLPFFGAVLLGAGAVAAVIPLGDLRPRGSRLVDSLSQGLHSSLMAIFPDFPLVFHVPGYGYSMESSRLTGGPPLLSSSPLFEVDGRPGDVLYLRTDVSYRYTGTGWAFSPAAELEDPRSAPEEAAFRIRLKLLSDLFTRIPVTPDSRWVQAGDHFYPLGSSGGIYPPGKLPLSRGDEVRLFTAPSPPGDFPEEGDSPRPSFPRDMAGSVSGELMALGKNFEGAEGAEVLIGIRKFLFDGFTYTLDTKEAADPISDFLFNTRRGYCVHFASAAALLAGLNDIPVRIARGFLAVLPFSREGAAGKVPGRTVITGYAAHMWPEVLTGEGRWIPWEVTPPMTDLGDPDVSFTDDPVTLNQLRYFGIASPGGDESEAVSEPFAPSSPVLPFSGGVLLCLSAFFLILTALRSRRLACALPRLVIRIRKKHGVPSPETGGWLRWRDGVIEILPEESATLKRMTRLILLRAYGPGGAGREEEAELLGLVRRISRGIGKLK